MSDTPETLAAILREMRDEETACSLAAIDDERTVDDLLNAYADRIEAAAEREFLKVSAQKVSEMTACNFRPYADGTAALAAVERHLDSIEKAAKEAYDAIVRDDWLMARSLSDEIRMSVSRAKSDANNLYMKDSRNSAPGNAAALRAALEKCAELGDQIDNWLGSDEATAWNCRNERSAAHNIMLTARAALAAPARN